MSLSVVEIAVHDQDLTPDLFDVQTIDEEGGEIAKVHPAPQLFVPDDTVADLKKHRFRAARHENSHGDEVLDAAPIAASVRCGIMRREGSGRTRKGRPVCSCVR